MIIFLYQSPNCYPIEKYFLSHRAKELAKKFRLISYDRFLRFRTFPRATYIFSDIERLPPAEQESAAQIWYGLTKAGLRVLNHPTRSLRRYSLLRKMHDLKVNSFNVYRLTENRLPKFPVFIRGENDHRGPLTQLLQSPEQLQAELDRFSREGISFDNKIMTEYVDVVDEKGYYTKYGDYCVAGQIISQHVQFARGWFVKDSTAEANNPDQIQRELEMGVHNPYEEQIRQVFEIAKIDYGRIDYSVVDGQIQVFEINTNPSIAAAPTDAGPREVNRLRFLNELTAAFSAIDDMDSGPKVKIPQLPHPFSRPSYKAFRVVLYWCSRQCGLLAFEDRIYNWAVQLAKSVKGMIETFKRRSV